MGNGSILFFIITDNIANVGQATNAASEWPNNAIWLLRNFHNIVSGDGLLAGWHQATVWTSDDELSIAYLVINFIQIWVEIQPFSFKKMHLKTFFF